MVNLDSIAAGITCMAAGSFVAAALTESAKQSPAATRNQHELHVGLAVGVSCISGLAGGLALAHGLRAPNVSTRAAIGVLCAALGASTLGVAAGAAAVD